MKSKIQPTVWALVLCFLVPPLAFAVQKPASAPAAKPEKAKPEEEALAPMDQPLIIVDGIGITSRQYASFLQSNPKILRQASDTEQGKREALTEVVTVFVLRKAMYEEGLLSKDQPNPSQKELVEAYEKLASKHFPVPPDPDDKEGFEYYQQHPSEFGIPEMTRLSQILFNVPQGADAAVEKSVKERAEKAMKRLESGEKFPEVAAALTENPIGKVTSGDIGFLEIQQEAWMKEGLKNVKVGEHSGILKSPSGYEILSVTDLRPGLISPYANVRETVIKELRDSTQKVLRDAFVKQLAKKTKVEVVHPSIKSLFPKGVFPE